MTDSDRYLRERERIIDYLQAHKQEFLQHYGIERIGLFGSLLRDDLREDSDIDIAIEMTASKKNLRNFLAFKRALENEFQRPVDLGIESSLKPAVKKQIAREIHYV